MATYYEFLQLAPGATDTEIQNSLETHYNQWRRLVTHHDPTVVSQATQALQTLETIRTTLTDPVKRAQYDVSLGGASTAGLADPGAAATFRPTPPNLPPVRNPEPVTQNMARTDAWVCPKCACANAIATRYCKQCGQSLGRDCPKCGRLTEAAATFCSECGVNLQEAEWLRQQADQEAERARVEAERLALETQATLGPLAKLAEGAWSTTKWGCFLAFVPYGVLLSLLLWFYAYSKARQALRLPQVPEGARYREIAQKAITWSFIPLMIFGVGVSLWILASCSAALSGSR